MEKPKIFNIKKQILGILLILLLVVATVFIFTQKLGAITFRDFMNYIRGLEAPLFLVLAFICVFLSLFSEAGSLYFILTKLWKRPRSSHTVVYGASDIYFSAITPSATGGQPAAAYYMCKTGVPASTATVALILNLFQYTLSLLVLGGIGFLIFPNIMATAPFKVNLFLMFAVVFNLFFVFLCLSCMLVPTPVQWMGKKCIALLSRLRLIRKREAKEAAFDLYLSEYRATLCVLIKNPSLWWAPLLLNLAQRIFMYLVPCMILLAEGGSPSLLLEAFGKQSLATLGANSVPIPGAMGVSEYLFVTLLGGMFRDKLSALFLVRFVSHYFNFIFSGLLTLAFHIRLHRKRKGNRNP